MGNAYHFLSLLLVELWIPKFYWYVVFCTTFGNAILQYSAIHTISYN